MRTTLRVLALAGTAALVAAPARADQARVIDDAGRVLTVGNFGVVAVDGGLTLRMPDGDILSWELRDQDRLVGYGIVPGAEALGEDLSPSLSRDPASHELWLVWSRRAEAGAPAQIVSVRFVGDAPDASSFTVLAAGPGDQLDPSVIHDNDGYGFVTWVDAGEDRTVKVLGISPAGSPMGVQDLSTGHSRQNSSPRLGVDPHGELFAAFVGTDLGTGSNALYVLTPWATGGGISHVPDPILELGLRTSLPTPLVGGSPAPAPEAVPALHLSVLGGTPVAWWTEGGGSTFGDLTTLFRYVAMGPEGWETSDVRTLDLGAGMVGSVNEALELIEARLRRVLSFAGQTGVPKPILPVRPFAARPFRVR